MGATLGIRRGETSEERWVSHTWREHSGVRAGAQAEARDGCFIR
jgi:hypothetical protein